MVLSIGRFFYEKASGILSAGRWYEPGLAGYTMGELRDYPVTGGMHMAKAGMRRPDPEDPHGTESRGKRQKFPKNEQPPVPELQGAAKTGKKHAKK